jgi:hypothetical protein
VLLRRLANELTTYQRQDIAILGVL